MAIIEALTVRLGSAVAKAVFKFWMKDTEIGKDTQTKIDKLLGRKLPDLRAQRRTLRFFERLSEEIADEIQPYFDSAEVKRNLTENEKEASILAVAETFDQAELDDRILLDIDLSPMRLEQYLLLHHPTATRDLNEAAKTLYSEIMREACNYVIEVTGNLPEFHASATRELLERETEIIALVKSILERLPQQRMRDNRKDSVHAFETEYLRQVARRLDQLELFGVTLHRIKPQYSLSVAYISLGAFTDDGLDSPYDLSTTRVEQVLSQSSRMLIKGEPGSGKTTLLQWIAVNAARESFLPPLEKWNELIPFYIRLRAYAEGDLPLIDGFIASVAKNMASFMPPGWVRSVMDEGRAIVLIDGVDELLAKSRTKTKRWVADLVQEFPDCVYIITSRPSAISDEWLQDCGFSYSILQPMGLNDIDRFVAHWHQGNSEALFRKDADDDLDQYKHSLLTTIRENPPVRNLASNPLLCAMLCALNLDRKNRIPRDRMELYRLALETLLERRDSERDISIHDGVVLSRAQKEVLLEDFAYWLLQNGYSDAKRQAFEERVKQKLKSMPQVASSADIVSTYLLERSGVLRQATVGRVDFLHRTFQEYLGAHAAVEEDDIGLLVGKATDDQWRQVIVLAAGHASVHQRSELITGLLKKSEHQNPSDAHRTRVLAVACRETALELAPDIREALDQVMRELFPPRTELDVHYLAAAGTDAVPYLKGHSKADGALVALCVRTLTRIGDEAALSAISEYSTDSRQEVIDQLVRAWDFFDEEEFARRVLAFSKFKGPLQLREKQSIAGVQYLKQLESLQCLESRDLTNFDPICGLEELRYLEISRCGLSFKLPNLERLRNLRTLIVKVFRHLSDISSIQGLFSLESLTIKGAEDLNALGALSGLRNLRYLSLEDCRDVDDLSALRTLKSLEELDLSGCLTLRSLQPIAMLPKLRKLWLPELSLADTLPEDITARLQIF